MNLLTFIFFFPHQCETEMPCPFDLRGEPPVFTVGEQVLVKTYHHEEQKLSWSGPHTVTHVIDLGVKVQGISDLVSNNNVRKVKS